MLVPCTDCGVQYDHKFGRCVVCGADYVPSPETKRAELRAESVELLRTTTVGNVHAHLVTNGLAEREADDVLREARREVRAIAKQHGLHVAASGVCLLGVACVVFVASGGFVLASGCLMVGGAMALVGGLKSVTGWTNLVPDND